MGINPKIKICKRAIQILAPPPPLFFLPPKRKFNSKIIGSSISNCQNRSNLGTLTLRLVSYIVFFSEEPPLLKDAFFDFQCRVGLGVHYYSTSNVKGEVILLSIRKYGRLGRGETSCSRFSEGPVKCSETKVQALL